MNQGAASNTEMAKEISSLKKKTRELESPEIRRKWLKEEVREIESQYEAMLNTCFGSIVLHDREGTILKCNDVFAGRSERSRDELIGKKVWPLFPPELRESRQALLEKVFAEGRPLSNEDEWRGNWMKYVLHPVFAVDGSVGRVAVYAENVTERKIARKSIKECERRYRELVESANCIILKWKRNGEITFLNEYGLSFFGFRERDLLGESLIRTIIQPACENNGDLALSLDKVFEYPERYEKGIVRHTCRDGRQALVSWTNRAIFDARGNPVEICSIGHDVTDCKNAERALRQSEEKYRVIAENMTDVITIMDLNFRFTFVSPSVMRLRGFTVEEAMAQSHEQRMTPESRQHLLRIFEEEMQREAGGKADPSRVRTIELEMYRKDMSTIWVELIASFLRDKDGKATGILSVARDITERKQMAQALAYKTMLLEAQSETAIDGILAVDNKGNVILSNKRFGEIWKIPPYLVNKKRNKPMLKYVLKQLKNPDEFSRRVAYLYDHHNEKDWDEVAFLDGRCLERYSSPLISAEGKYLGRIWFFRDTTERKRIEAALKESQLRLKAIIDLLPDATFVIDKNGKVTAWNQAIENMTGVRSENMIGKGDYEYALSLYGERRPILIDLALLSDEEFLQQGYYENIVRKGTVLRGEAFIPETCTGKNACLWGNASRLYDEDGDVIGAVESIRDITDRKEMEEALRESENRYQGIFKNTGTGMVILEEDGVISLANSEFEKLSGYERNEIEGKINWTVFPEKSDLERMIRQHSLRLVDPGLAEKQYEFRLIRRDGCVRNVYMTIGVIPGTKKCVASLMDVTDRKEAEEKRRALEARLLRSEKMEALGLMAGRVAHDLNNVMGVLMGYSELIQYHVEESSPVRPYVTKILSAGGRAAAIIEDMLTLARRGVHSREVVNLNALIRDFLKTPEFEGISVFHPRVLMETHLEAAPLNIVGSPHQISKTIMNLVSNAAEAMPEGGVLTIATRNQYMDRPVQGYDEIREGDYVAFSVSDTGEGISASDIKHIFEPFYTKKVMGRSGTGLGLSVVWGTVKDLSGYIDVQSEVGKGSTFTLYFPVTREELAGESIPVSVSEYMGKGESILVVDDIKGQRELAAGMLKKLNYRVDIVSSGEEALEYMKEHCADLVVLDMIMDPGMDGLTAYRNILEIHPGQKAIIVSGFSETDRVRQAQALGAGAYVKKPYTLEKLGLAVRKELDR